MGKVNSLFDIKNGDFIKDKERKTVSEHCLEDPPALDTNYLAKLKKLNKKKKVPIDDLLAIAVVNNYHKFPLDELVRHADCLPEILLKKTLAIASKQDQVNKQVPLRIEKNQLANNFPPIIVGEWGKGLSLQTAKVDGWNKLLLERPRASEDRAADIILKENEPLFTEGKFGDVVSAQRLPDSDVDSPFAKNTEQKSHEAHKLALSPLAILSFYEQNNVPLSEGNKHKTEDSKRPSTFNRSMTDTEKPFQTPKTGLSSEEGGMRYHFNKWQGDHSVKIQFDKITDHRVYLSPSNFIVEKQLSEHLNELPTKFKVHIDDENESYRYKQSKDKAYDEKDKE